jgi:hypothetical protein
MFNDRSAECALDCRRQTGDADCKEFCKQAKMFLLYTLIFVTSRERRDLWRIGNGADPPKGYAADAEQAGETEIFVYNADNETFITDTGVCRIPGGTAKKHF